MPPYPVFYRGIWRFFVFNDIQFVTKKEVRCLAPPLFLLQAINLHGILCIESLATAPPLAQALACQREPEQAPLSAAPFFCLMKCDCRGKAPLFLTARIPLVPSSAGKVFDGTKQSIIYTFSIVKRKYSNKSIYSVIPSTMMSILVLPRLLEAVVVLVFLVPLFSSRVQQTKKWGRISNRLHTPDPLVPSSPADGVSERRS